MGAQPLTAVVIDTNVVVSAMLFGGKPGHLASLWQQRRIRPYASSAIVEEYLRVFACPRFGLTEAQIAYLIYEQILPFFEIVSVDSAEPIVSEDPEDDKFLYCAVESAARFIISGDHHLLSLAAYKAISIVTVSAFLEAIS